MSEFIGSNGGGSNTPLKVLSESENKFDCQICGKESVDKKWCHDKCLSIPYDRLPEYSKFMTKININEFDSSIKAINVPKFYYIVIKR